MVTTRASPPHAVAVHENICADVEHGRALVFDLSSASGFRGLHVSPLAVVLQPEFRIIHDLTFARAGGHSGGNNDTELSSPPSCELGHVLRDDLLRVLFFATYARSHSYNRPLPG